MEHLKVKGLISDTEGSFESQSEFINSVFLEKVQDASLSFINYLREQASGGKISSLATLKAFSYQILVNFLSKVSFSSEALEKRKSSLERNPLLKREGRLLSLFYPSSHNPLRASNPLEEVVPYTVGASFFQGTFVSGVLVEKGLKKEEKSLYKKIYFKFLTIKDGE